MGDEFTRIGYVNLTSRQRENFNFHKASSILAEYGYTSIRLSDDWNGADFIALHVDGSSLRIQLKGRLTFDKKYRGKNIWVCFPADGQSIYVYPHDQLIEVFAGKGLMVATRSWERGMYSFPHLSRAVKALLEPFQLSLEIAAPKAAPKG